MSSQDKDPAQRPVAVPDASSSPLRRLFAIPRPIKLLFDKVPVITYDANALPQRCRPARSDRARLHVFSTDADAADNRPSYNPSCLKWQTFLRMSSVDFDLVASNNHASPTGVLPFLQPVSAAQSTAEQGPSRPIASSQLLKYVERGSSTIQKVENIRLEAYKSLVDLRLRNAWLLTLYLEPVNFDAVAAPRYILPASRSALVRWTLTHQLRAAAELELCKTSTVLDPEDIYTEAEKAFAALSTLLGEGTWFFECAEPSLFDASVFAYTHLLLDQGMQWQERRLCRALESRGNLVDHCARLYERCYAR